MADSALVKEFQEFNQKAADLQQQYRTLLTQVIPANEMESRSLQNVAAELEDLPETNPVYHSHGKIFIKSTIPATKEMISQSTEANKRNIAILSEKKKILEKQLKEAEEKQKFYLSKLKPAQ